jgi:hypothetical protein
MARSATRSNQKPDTLMQGRSKADRAMKTSCDARPGPYIASPSLRPRHVQLSPTPEKLRHRSEPTLRANCRHRSVLKGVRSSLGGGGGYEAALPAALPRQRTLQAEGLMVMLKRQTTNPSSTVSAAPGRRSERGRHVDFYDSKVLDCLTTSGAPSARGESLPRSRRSDRGSVVGRGSQQAGRPAHHAAASASEVKVRNC